MFSAITMKYKSRFWATFRICLSKSERDQLGAAGFCHSISKAKDYNDRLATLKENFNALAVSSDVQKRGYEFEKLLNSLFSFFDLQPKNSFRIQGEQIDGAFTHDGTDYLIEAKWQTAPVNNADLYAFQGKIEGKLKNTLGLFISINGFSKEAAIGKHVACGSMILMDGTDFVSLLDGRIKLDEMIRIKRQHASSTGEIMYRVPC